MMNKKIDLFKNFYKDKNILVTGHTGFKGSWLCIWLNELGANVIGYSLDPYTEKDNFVVSNLSEKIIDIRGDIRDEKSLNDVVKKYNPEIIFHLAAQPLVIESYKNPKETYDINVMGTLNILEAIRKSTTLNVGIMITTDKCYENKEQIWGYRECDAMGGYDPYSSSKGCCELLISSYRNSFFDLDKYDIHNKVIGSVRAGNVIGGGDWSKDRIIPDCIRALEIKEDIIVRNPKSIRPWQHVLEPLYGYLILAKELYENPLEYSGGWNFGPSYKLQEPVSNMVDLLIKYWGSGRWIDNSKSEKLHEANLLSLDCTKAKLLLNWDSSLTIEETIEFTCKWYKYFNKENMYEFNVQQINKYCELIKI